MSQRVHLGGLVAAVALAVTVAACGSFDPVVTAKPGIPTQIFRSLQDAREWIRSMFTTRSSRP